MPVTITSPKTNPEVRGLRPASRLFLRRLWDRLWRIALAYGTIFGIMFVGLPWAARRIAATDHIASWSVTDYYLVSGLVTVVLLVVFTVFRYATEPNGNVLSRNLPVTEPAKPVEPKSVRPVRREDRVLRELEGF